MRFFLPRIQHFFPWMCIGVRGCGVDIQAPLSCLHVFSHLSTPFIDSWALMVDTFARSSYTRRVESNPMQRDSTRHVRISILSVALAIGLHVFLPGPLDNLSACLRWMASPCPSIIYPRALFFPLLLEGRVSRKGARRERLYCLIKFRFDIGGRWAAGLSELSYTR